MSRIFQNKTLLFVCVILTLITMCAIFAPILAPYDPAQLGQSALCPPGTKHLLGSDDFGRDILSRAIYGARVSLSVASIAVAISLLTGFVLGMTAGYFGGFAEAFIMRFVDIMLSFPSIFLVLAVQSILPPSIFNVMVVIGLTSWMTTARLVRAEVISVKERPFIESAKVLGASHFRIMFVHILPNVLAPVIVAGTLTAAGAILTESALSFLGLGVQPPFASWGNMLQDSQAYLRDAPWMSLVPGGLIFVVVLSLHLLSEELRKGPGK